MKLHQIGGRLIILQTVGVKLKVVVTDVDSFYPDDLDKLIKLLNPTPARNVSVATWTSVTVRGLRHSSPTRFVYQDTRSRSGPIES